MKKLLIILSTIFVISGALGILSACNVEGQQAQNQTEEPADMNTSAEPAIPENLQWDTDTWTLSWDASENADSYVILVEEWGEYYTTTETCYNFEADMTNDSTYTILVHSLNSIGPSEWSEEILAQTETSNPVLVYTLMEDGQGYEVDRMYSNLDYGLEGRVVIADYYNGLPVKSIAENAFTWSGLNQKDTETGAYCNTVTTSFHLPKYLESIGDYAFSHCIALEEITFPDSVSSIGHSIFTHCIKLSKINNFPDIITEIPSNTFNHTAISEFSFSDNVVSIGYDAFNGCENLTEIIILDSITEIGNRAFKDCVNLKAVYYYGTAEEWNNIEIGSRNTNLTEDIIYYYSETEPALNEDGTAYDGNFWHYDENGNPVAWVL